MSLPWYRRFPDNFIAGTVGLTLEEKGAYSLVLDLIYVRGGPVPDEPRYIAGVCNCSVRKWNTIRQRLIDLGKIEAVNGFLMNHRAEEELIISAKLERERAENGAKGGNKTAENRGDESKNNGVGAATLPARARVSTSTPFKKEGACALDPTDGLMRLDRNADEALFKACEALTETVPPYMQFKSWPADVVAAARKPKAA